MYVAPIKLSQTIHKHLPTYSFVN